MTACPEAPEQPVVTMMQHHVTAYCWQRLVTQDLHPCSDQMAPTI